MRQNISPGCVLATLRNREKIGREKNETRLAENPAKCLKIDVHAPSP